MKKISVLFLLVATIVQLQGQVTKFKVELGGLYGLPTDKDVYSAGIGGYLHPSYFVSDQISLGLKGESVVIGAADGLNVSISAIGSYLATFNYYFTVSKIRPYAGIGVGIYTLGSVEVGGTSEVYDFGDKFGVAPKLGLDLGHFTLNVSYNYIFGLDEGIDKNYLTIGIGAFFGGGVHGKGSKSSKNRIISIDDEEEDL